MTDPTIKAGKRYRLSETVLHVGNVMLVRLGENRHDGSDIWMQSSVLVVGNVIEVQMQTNPSYDSDNWN